MTPTAPQPTGGTPAKRWLWALGGLVVVLAVVLVVVLVTQRRRLVVTSSTATSSSTTTSPPATSSAPAASSAPTTTSAPTTAAPPATTRPLPPVTDDPQTYAEFLFAAWQNGNQTAAADVANAAVGQPDVRRALSAAVTWTLANLRPGGGIPVLHLDRLGRRHDHDDGAHAHRWSAGPGRQRRTRGRLNDPG